MKKDRLFNDGGEETAENPLPTPEAEGFGPSYDGEDDAQDLYM